VTSTFRAIGDLGQLAVTEKSRRRVVFEAPYRPGGAGPPRRAFAGYRGVPDIHRGDFDVDEDSIGCGMRILMAPALDALGAG
jgi:hypothetical protein